ncbi:MAG: hypothetical protein MZU79_01330 [Anaerotruncus sp.]|nr:hypothetical protein [Anaerotruncus sp.]
MAVDLETRRPKLGQRPRRTERAGDQAGRPPDDLPGRPGRQNSGHRYGRHHRPAETPWNSCWSGPRPSKSARPASSTRPSSPDRRRDRGNIATRTASPGVTEMHRKPLKTGR